MTSTPGARILIAPDSFKGSATAQEVAEAIAQGWLAERPDDAVTALPLADGGEGTLDVLERAVPGAVRHPVRVTGPDGRPVSASWLTIDGDAGPVAVVELADASGLDRLDTLIPWDAHTRGVGEVIRAALADAPSELLLALGGSSSTDGGLGLLAALGAIALDASGDPVADGTRGLADIASLDLSGLPALPTAGVTVLSDVTNPLLGPRGAAAVFGPQKGFATADLLAAEAALARLAALLPIDPATPGAGAAGGTGAGLLAWGAHLEPGADRIAQLVGLDRLAADSVLVITGEGRFDAQTAGGKLPSRVASAARASGIPWALVAGSIAAETDDAVASVALVDISGSTAAAIADPVPALRAAGARLARGWTADGLDG
ncbi:glycerate kinase [Schumannella luteola]|uniref:Glycerate kinase n=1 Tax=Schumannella luteola TaxID=472059 RepID=A0A852YE44_9MICO|nr:glycerate kinase [Schumannella luteola]